MKAAFFAGSMKTGHDGVTRVLYKLIEYLNKYNIENIFISAIIPGEKEQPTKMFRVPSLTFPLYKEYKLPVPGNKLIKNYLNDFKPDIIHINSPCPLGAAALRYGLKYKLPVVATYHTHFTSYAKYYKIKVLEECGWNYFRSLYNKCETVYVPSKTILNELISHGLNTVEFLPHGVDTEMFNPKFKDDNWKIKNNLEGKTVLLYAGRLVWEKDLKTLAETYKILEKRDDIAFVLVGEGPVKKELELLMPKAGFLGYKSGKELSVIYASSDIFVFPSTTETFGNVVVEAMASGLSPVCVREGGAYSAIKENITGLIAEPKNPEDLCKKILSLTDNTELRKNISINAINFAREQTWDKIFNRLFTSYSSIIHNYNSGNITAA